MTNTTNPPQQPFQDENSAVEFVPPVRCYGCRCWFPSPTAFQAHLDPPEAKGCRDAIRRELLPSPQGRQGSTNTASSSSN